MSGDVLSMHDLEVTVTVGGRRMPAVRGATLAVARGEIVGLIGESGSGKTLTLKALLNMLPPGCDVTAGEIRWRGEDLRAASARRWRELRRSELCYVPADSASMNPVYRLADQLVESLTEHVRPGARRRLGARIVKALMAVGLGGDAAEARSIARRYPHELSGGMRQRALIAMALERHGGILVADEPTSGLDITTQRQVLQLLADLRDETGLGMLITSHDLDMIGDIADRVVVMYGGQVMEHGPRDAVFGDPRHPYTVGLLDCIPPVAAGTAKLRTIPGNPPRLEELPEGCCFRPRCLLNEQLGEPQECLTEPALDGAGPAQPARCHFAGQEVHA